MLIFKYLLLATVAVLAAPIPFHSDPSPPSDNVLSARQSPPGPMGLPPTQPPMQKACASCRDINKLCSGAPPPCKRCIRLGLENCHFRPKKQYTRPYQPRTVHPKKQYTRPYQPRTVHLNLPEDPYSSLHGVTGAQHRGTLAGTPVSHVSHLQQFPQLPVMRDVYASYSSIPHPQGPYGQHPPHSLNPEHNDGHLLDPYSSLHGHGVTGAQHRGTLAGTPVSHVSHLQQFPRRPVMRDVYASYSSIPHPQGPYGQHPPHSLNPEHNDGHLLDSYSSLHGADVNRGALDETHVQNPQPGPVMAPDHPQYIGRSSLDGALVQNPQPGPVMAPDHPQYIGRSSLDGAFDETHVQNPQPGPVMAPDHPQYIGRSSLDGAFDMSQAFPGGRPPEGPHPA